MTNPTIRAFANTARAKGYIADEMHREGICVLHAAGQDLTPADVQADFPHITTADFGTTVGGLLYVSFA
jgi:hypothetical protein